MSGALQDRVVLLTGASRGIGAAVAEACAKAGAQLILVARTSGALEEVDDRVKAVGGSATLVPLDLAAPEGIERMAHAVAERWGRVDAVIGNAGILGQLMPVAHVSQKDWDSLMAINVTSNWRLIRAFDPLLRQSDAGRAVFVTSGAAQNRGAYWGPYAASKAALDALVYAYAAETVKTNIRVNLLSPGAVATRMRAGAFPGENPETLAKPEDIAPLFVELASPACDKHGELIRAQA